MSIRHSSRTIQRRALVALAVIIGALALAGTSQAQAATYEFRPTSLYVKDVEDWGWGATDEVRMYYNGAKVWDATVYNTEFVEGWRLPTLRFSGPDFRIDLFEADSESNFQLGRRYISAKETYWETGVTFGGGWAGYEYELRYNVVEVD